jgi:hypothetical protein
MNNMRPIHPGEIIKEEYLEPLNMSANALAVAPPVSGWLPHERKTNRKNSNDKGDTMKVPVAPDR